MIGELSGLACAAAWAIISLVMRSVAERVSPVVVNGLRVFFAAVTVGAIVLLSGRVPSLLAMPGDVFGAIVASGVLGQAIGDALFVRSAKQLGAARALPLSSSSPLLTLVLAILFLGEQVSFLNAAGAVLVVVGIVLIAIPYGPLLGSFRAISPADRSGVLAAVAAAGCYALSTVVLRNSLVEIDILVANLVRLVTATVMLLGLEIAQAGIRPKTGLTRRSIAIMALAGILSVFSTSMYLTSVQYAGAAKASILTSTSPLFGLPLALVFLRERVNRRVISGTFLSVFGIWLVLWR